MSLMNRAAALTLAAALGLLGGPSVSQERPSRDQALHVAVELVNEISKDGMVAQFVARSWPAFEPQLQESMPGASPATMASLKAEFQTIVVQHTKDLLAAAPAIYTTYFTVAELRDMLAFYRSPTGQKALRVMPNVIADSVRLSADRMPAVTAEIDRAFRSRLKARGVDLPI